MMKYDEMWQGEKSNTKWYEITYYGMQSCTIMKSQTKTSTRSFVCDPIYLIRSDRLTQAATAVRTFTKVLMPKDLNHGEGVA